MNGTYCASVDEREHARLVLPSVIVRRDTKAVFVSSSQTFKMAPVGEHGLCIRINDAFSGVFNAKGWVNVDEENDDDRRRCAHVVACSDRRQLSLNINESHLAQQFHMFIHPTLTINNTACSRGLAI